MQFQGCTKFALENKAWFCSTTDVKFHQGGATTTLFKFTSTALEEMEAVLAANPTTVGVLERYERAELLVICEFVRTQEPTHWGLVFANIGGFQFPADAPHGIVQAHVAYVAECSLFLPSVLA
jgi:hypothetical protein